MSDHEASDSGSRAVEGRQHGPGGPRAGNHRADVLRRRKQCVDLRLDQATRLKELDKENARLKKLVANQALASAILKEVSWENL